MKRAVTATYICPVNLLCFKPQLFFTITCGVLEMVIYLGAPLTHCKPDKNKMNKDRSTWGKH